MNAPAIDPARTVRLIEALLPMVEWVPLPTAGIPLWPAPQAPILVLPAGATADLVSALRDTAALQPFDDQMQHTGSGAQRVSYDHLATWLVRRATDVGAGRALDDLERYIATRRFRCLDVLALHGVTLARTVPLENGVQLVPYGAVPESQWKMQFGSFTPGRPPIPSPTAALLRWHEVPVHHSADGLPSSGPAHDVSPLLEAAGLLPVVVPSGVIAVGQWSEPDASVPCSGIGGGAGFYPEIESLSTVELTSKQCQYFKRLYQHYMKVPASQRERLHVPLERLNAALRRPTLVDAAIDLGIVMEAVFLGDQDKDRGELTFRLSTRAARWLGTNPTSRRDAYDLSRLLYRLRSIAVHTGKLHEHIDGKKTKPRTEDVLRRGFQLAAEAIQRVILRGEPDWDKLLHQ